MILGVLDSGVGGLSVLPCLLNPTGAATSVNRPPITAIHYLADTAWMPYGAKPVDSLGQRIAQHINWLVTAHHVDAVVLACNTATTVALLTTCTPTHGPNELDANLIPHLEAQFSEAFPVPVISPVLATAKGLHQRNDSLGNVIVLATDTLLSTGIYKAVLAYYLQGNPTVIGVSGQHLAQAVEVGKVTNQHPLIRQIATELDAIATRPSHLKNPVAPSVILGCTHYPHVWPLIADHCQQSFHAINPATYIPNALTKAINLPSLSTPLNQEQPAINFWVTGDNCQHFQQQATHLMPSLAQHTQPLYFHHIDLDSLELT